MKETSSLDKAKNKRGVQGEIALLCRPQTREECKGTQLNVEDLTVLEDCECRGFDKTRHVLVRSRRGVDEELTRCSRTCQDFVVLALVLFAVLFSLHKKGHDTRHTTHDTRHTTHNTRHTTHDTQHTTHDTKEWKTCWRVFSKEVKTCWRVVSSPHGLFPRPCRGLDEHSTRLGLDIRSVGSIKL